METQSLDIRSSHIINPQVLSHKVRLYASSDTWIEGTAIQQLEKASELPGVTDVVGLPDLHPGKGIPIGAAILTRDLIYPHLVGSDIGCGMSLWQTDIKITKVKVDRWLKTLRMDAPWEGDREAYIREQDIKAWHDSLGTVGGGNHFAEIQKIESIDNGIEAEKLGLNRKCLQLMIHSGSRGLGNAILRCHTDEYGGKGIPEGNPRAVDYLRGHDEATLFARGNRRLIALRMLEALRGGGALLADMAHNWVERIPEGWLHRKGAAPSSSPYVLIPGSRGTFSYVVKPRCNKLAHGCSLAHGAGRKWNRSNVKGRLENRYNVVDLQKTAMGSRVLCEDKQLLFEEAPEAYKQIDTVISDMKNLGLIEVVAILRPVLTYKTDGSKYGKT